MMRQVHMSDSRMYILRLTTSSTTQASGGVASVSSGRTNVGFLEFVEVVVVEFFQERTEFSRFEPVSPDAVEWARAAREDFTDRVGGVV